MTVRQKQGCIGVSMVSLLALVVLAGSVGYRQLPSPQEEPAVRVVLVARDMAFAAAQDPEALNPGIRLPGGRVVEIELRNDDPGSAHNLVLTELKLRTRMLKTGESAVLRFRTPAAGTTTYHCSVHPLMMRGQLVFGDTALAEAAEAAAPHAGHAH